MKFKDLGIEGKKFKKFSDLKKPDEKPRTKPGVIEFYTDKKGEYRWHIIASNPEKDIIADSSEGYKNKDDCINGLDSLRWHIANSPVELNW